MKTGNSYDISYLQKTYAGWLGKIIGIRLGSPIEGWSYDDIQAKYGEITDYLVDYHDYAADDDSNGPLFFARALMDFSPEKVTEREMGLTWLNYVPEHHGFFWWGGYGISTEHTAYDNMRKGIKPPLSGSIEQNGAACAEQIGGQIFSDCWGFLCPGKPVKAADYARKMARVSHDGEAVYGGMFVAACISAAYGCSNIHDVIKAGLSVIPEDSIFAGLYRDVADYYRNDNAKDWRGCMLFLKENYGYDKYPGSCHIIPNAGVIFLSLLYGGGDFSLTQCICNMCGWDTDCNAGNVGAILGVLTGVEGIDNKWIAPVNDLLIASSVLGGLNIGTVSQSAQLFCKIGYSLANENIPDFWHDRLTTKDSLIHFDLEKSTGAFRTKTSEADRICILENCDFVSRNGHRSLRISSAEMNVNTTVTGFVKTYYKPEDLHDSRYDPAFTPIVFPGQKVSVVVYNNSPFPVEASILAYDINNQEEYLSQSHTIAGEWKTITFILPVVEGGLIKELGISVKPSVPGFVPGDLDFYINEMRWSGTPHYNIDFSKECVEHFGYGNGTLHREISQITYLNGLWELDGPYLSGSSSDSGEAYTGYYHAEDYELHCTVRPQKGEHHLVNFRVQGGVRSYAFGFYGSAGVAFLKKEEVYRPLISLPFSYELDKEYVLSLWAESNRFRFSIDGRPVMTFEDCDSPYLTGQVGFTVLEGSHCHYRDLRLLPVSGSRNGG